MLKIIIFFLLWTFKEALYVCGPISFCRKQAAFICCILGPMCLGLVEWFWCFYFLMFSMAVQGVEIVR
jgi:hypothetical protein